ncbi:unnamed protein product [Closterium sp. NIES-54]
MPNKTRKQIRRAHSENGVYILDFSIPNCSGDSQELIDLVPLRFEHIHHRDWKHPDIRPWVPHHAHPHELALHDPDPDGICRDCHTPTASTSAIAGRGLVAIAEAVREAPPDEGLSNLELETATRVVFGTEENPLPRPASQHLRGMLRGTGVGTFDAHGVPRPSTKEKFLEIYSHQRDSTKKLIWRKRRNWRVAKRKSFANGVLRSRAARLPGVDGEKRRAPPMKGGGEAPADGEQQPTATPADGAPHLAARQADGALPAKAGELLARTKGGKKRTLRRNLQTNCYAKLEKVYSDFLNVGHCGMNDEMYTLTFVDAGTHYVWIVNVEAHSKAYKVFHLWLAHAQRQSGEKLKIWQSDGAAEFRSKEMQDYLPKKGIEHHVSLPYAHQQQGIAEHTNRTLMTKVRALMKQSKLPPTYWTYAMHHAVRVHNLLSTTAITGNSSPHVKWTGTKGSTSLLRVQKIKNARDVIFYERLFLRQFRKDEQANANRVYANDGHSYVSPWDKAAIAILEQDPRGEFTRGNRRDDDDDNDSLGGGAGAAGGGGSGSGRDAAPPAPPEPESDDDDMQEVIPQHCHDSTVSGLQLLGLHTTTSTVPRVIELKNPRQALRGPHNKEWHKGMDAEIKALESRDTWVLVDRAAIKGRNILSWKWVFRVKTAADGTIEQFKVRWVVRGYDQRHGIDFDQTFAPVNRHTSVRILLAVAAARHLPLQQIDVKNVFLYALVDVVIYVEQPHTYDEGDSRMCQLRKSLYGIKQAPRLGQQYLHNILLEIGFKQLPHDPSMYRRDFRGEYILLTVRLNSPIVRRVTWQPTSSRSDCHVCNTSTAPSSAE